MAARKLPGVMAERRTTVDVADFVVFEQAHDAHHQDADGLGEIDECLQSRIH